jgi:unsaturated rhamnogalacturonyl hydrolase
MNNQKITTHSNKIFLHFNNIVVILSFTLFLLILFNSCHDTREASGSHMQNYSNGMYLQMSVKMADSQMERLGTSLMIGGSDPKAKWNYTTGLFLKSLLDLWKVTGEQKYLDYVKFVIDSFIQPDGSIKKYKMSDYNLDKINSGKVLLQLFNITKEDKYKFASDTLREQLRKQPRTSDGGFWHKKRYPWQMWLDGIYMNTPFYAEYSIMFSDPDGLSDIATQIKLIDQKTRDPKTGLRYHAWDESNKQAWADPVTGCSPHFWGRAMGWYMMALVDVLDYIPENNDQRGQILFIFKDVAKAVKKYQDENGLWYQILDQGERKGNYFETSCSSMFVYAFAKASNKGYLGEEYHGSAINGYNGLLSLMITEDPDGKINLENICGVAGLGGNPYRDGSFEYYINEPIVANDLKGVGPFIMAGLQMEQLYSKHIED